MIKTIFPLTLFLLFYVTTVQGKQETVSIILDTDISSDVDDVGAVAVLHSLAEQNEVDILAMMVSSGDPWSGPCLDALNTWFGRPDIPVGVIRAPTVTHESKYTKAIAAKFPHDLQRSTDAPDATDLYRQVLSNQPDNSVTIITVGYLTNLKNLLNSGPDSISPMSGVELVLNKVKQLVCMGGDYTKGREWNFYQDAYATQYVVKNWPSPIVFIGYSVGIKVLTGEPLRHSTVSSPVRLAYERYNNFTGRPSWDQIAVLYGGLDEPMRAMFFKTSDPGLNSVSEDGSNHWHPHQSGNHLFVSLNQSSKKIAEQIDTMMLHR